MHGSVWGGDCSVLPTLGRWPGVWGLERGNAKRWPRASRVGDFGAHGGIRNAKSGCGQDLTFSCTWTGSGWGWGAADGLVGEGQGSGSGASSRGGGRRVEEGPAPAQSLLTPRAAPPCRNFTLFHHPMYGNCYTFNSKENEVVLSTSMGGSEYGERAGTPERASPPAARGLPAALAGARAPRTPPRGSHPRPPSF